MKTWKLFVKTMSIMGRRIYLYLAGIFFMSTGWAMFNVCASLLMKNVVDAAQTGNTDAMLWTIIMNVAGGIVILIVYRFAAIMYNVEAKRAYGTLGSKLFYHEVRLPYEYYETHHSGDFMSKLSYDLVKTGSIYGSRLRRTIAPLLQVGVYLIPMLILGCQITLCLIAVNVVMLLVNTLFIEPISRVTKKLSATNAKMTENLSNLLQGMEQARMNRAGKNTVDEFLTENDKYAKESNGRIFCTACLEGFNNGFDLLCALAFLMVGIYFVQKGYVTLGALAAIYSLYGSFSYQFLQLGRYLPELIGCLTNAQNLFDFMEEEREPDNWYKNVDSTRHNNGDAGKFIDISDVDFNYSDDKEILTGYSLSSKKGETIAITGPSGCGKSTLSKLLLSLYPIQGGNISIGGRSYYDLSNEEIRKMIAYVPQEPYLFNMSVRENILIGKPDATDEEIIDAAKRANAHDFIINLEEGYDTNVGERGNRLSGGQRQRIAIARAIIKDAPVILLDEATSALDNESEQMVNDAMKKMKKDRNIIMIAHRPSTIALADRVCSMGE